MKHNDERFIHAQLGGGNSLWWRQLDACGLIASSHLFRIARLFARRIASGKILFERLISKITKKRTLFKFHSSVANKKRHPKSQKSKNNFLRIQNVTSHQMSSYKELNKSSIPRIQPSRNRDRSSAPTFFVGNFLVSIERLLSHLAISERFPSRQ